MFFREKLVLALSLKLLLRVQAYSFGDWVWSNSATLSVLTPIDQSDVLSEKLKLICSRISTKYRLFSKGLFWNFQLWNKLDLLGILLTNQCCRSGLRMCVWFVDVHMHSFRNSKTVSVVWLSFLYRRPMEIIAKGLLRGRKNSQNPPVFCPPPSATPSNTHSLIPLSAAFSLPKDHAGELQRTRHTHSHTSTHTLSLSLCVTHTHKHTHTHLLHISLPGTVTDTYSGGFAV